MLSGEHSAYGGREGAGRRGRCAAHHQGVRAHACKGALSLRILAGTFENTCGGHVQIGTGLEIQSVTVTSKKLKGTKGKKLILGQLYLTNII